MIELFKDIETIPVQNPELRADVERTTRDFYAARIAGLQADLKAIAPPGNYKDPAKIEEWNKLERPKKEKALAEQIAHAVAEEDVKAEETWRKTSFDGALCQIVVIGYALADEKPTVLFSPADKVLTLAAEADLLRRFYGKLEQIPEQDRMALIWTGHNIVEFDLRVLYQRSVVHGIKPPYWIPFGAKPWGDRVFDTMVEWAGGRGRVGQDKLCRILGVDAKGSELGDDIDGSKVWDFVKAGRIEDVATYCGGDVHRVREIARRLTFKQAA